MQEAVAQEAPYLTVLQSIDTKLKNRVENPPRRFGKEAVENQLDHKSRSERREEPDENGRRLAAVLVPHIGPVGKHF